MGKRSVTFMTPIYSTVVLYDYYTTNAYIIFKNSLAIKGVTLF